MSMMLALAAATMDAPGEPTSRCVGQSLDDCVKSVRDQFNVDEDDLRRSISENSEKDVNGNPVRKNPAIMFAIWRKSKLQLTQADIHFSSDNRVTSAGISFNGFLDIAKTESDYDKSELLPAMQVLFQPSCWGGEKLDLYKWFENSVKPTIMHDPVDRTVDTFGARENYFSHSQSIPFCGKHIRYSHIAGSDTDNVTLENPNGVSSMTTISVED